MREGESVCVSEGVCEGVCECECVSVYVRESVCVSLRLYFFRLLKTSLVIIP